MTIENTHGKPNECVGSIETTLLTLGALTGAVSCMCRADYNLPIFLFTYVITNVFKKKDCEGDRDIFCCIILMLWSFFIDVLFFSFVYFKVWESNEFKAIASWEEN